jgi:hypothetical protein
LVAAVSVAVAMMMRPVVVGGIGIVSATANEESAAEKQEDKFPFRKVAALRVVDWAATKAFMHTKPFPKRPRSGNPATSAMKLSRAGMVAKFFRQQSDDSAGSTRRRDGHFLEYLLRGIRLHDLVSRRATERALSFWRPAGGID